MSFDKLKEVLAEGKAGEAGDDEPVDTKEAKASDKPDPAEKRAERPKVQSKAERQGQTPENTDSEGEDSEDVGGADKRIRQELKRRKDAERKLKAMEGTQAALRRELDEIKAALAKQEQERQAVEAPQRPGPDASPEEVAEWADAYEKHLTARVEQNREQMRQEMLAQQHFRDEEEQRELHDGSDGKPSYDELHGMYFEKIKSDPDPAYKTIRDRIVKASNGPRALYREMNKLYEADFADEREEETSLLSDREAMRTPESHGGPVRSNNRPTPNEVERAHAKQIFGIDPEKLAARRAKRTGVH